MPRLDHPEIAAIMALYFVVIALIGGWATYRTRTARDFFVAGRGVGVVPAALAAMAATISGFAFIGGPGLVYTAGIGAVFLMLPAALTGALQAWLLAKRLRLLGEFRGLITIPDAIGARYDSRLAQGLAGGAMIFAIIGYMATNLLALGIVIDAVFATGLGPGIWIGMAITLAYSVSGGILAGIYNDVFQGALMGIASVLVFGYTLHATGGLSGMSLTLLAAEPAFISPWGTMGPLAALSLFFVFGVGSLGQPHVVHKYYMVRDPQQLRWLPLIMTTAILTTILLYFGVGVAVRTLVERGTLEPLSRPDLATTTFLLRFTPVLLAGLVFAGVGAAIMSTVNSFMNIGAAVLTHDLPIAFSRPAVNELLWGRVWTVVISVLAALLAQLSGAVVAFLGIFGWGLFASSLVPSLAVGLNWKGATREGAIASILTGVTFTLTFETLAYFKALSVPAGLSIAGLALVLSLLVFVGVSWLTRHRSARLDPVVQLVMDA